MLATIELCFLAFESIISYLDKASKSPIYNQFLQLPNSTVEYPMFVTWKKKGQLRGCIGTFEPKLLYEGIRSCSRSAAFRDSRFSPINFQEISQLECTVNLLHSFEDAQNVYDWEIGKHGIILTIDNQYSATFLPEVMEEQKWTKDETLKQLALKAGYRGPINSDLWKKSNVRRYRSSLISANYEQFLEYSKSFRNNNKTDEI